MQDLRRNLGQRNDAGENAQLGTSPRHALDGAARFDLADGEAALTVDGLHPGGTVRAHSRHDHPERKVSEGFSHRGHEYID